MLRLQESVLELPRELRQLEQMRCERQERAADRYPVTEQGLLARFNPRNKSPSEPTAPAAEEPSQTQADSFEPPTQDDPPESPPGVTSVSPVDLQASPDPATQQMSVNSLLSLGLGRGCTEVPMDTVGRGRPPSFGRGFLLQIPQDQIPGDSWDEPRSSSPLQSFRPFRY